MPKCWFSYSFDVATEAKILIHEYTKIFVLGWSL